MEKIQRRNKPTASQETELAGTTDIMPQESLKEHFRELRKRLIYIFIAVAVAFFVVTTLWADRLVQLLSVPVREKGIEFIYVGLSEALTSQLEVSFIAAMILVSPFILYQFWKFVEPALYEEEKKHLLIFLACSVILFLLGVMFGYGVVFLSAITFFVYTGIGIATPMLSIHQYVGFLFTFVLSFGIVFEMPMGIYVLCRLGIVTPEALVSVRKYVVLAIFIIAAFLTPPDALSQVLMALPMLLLYEVGILVAKATCSRRRAAEA